MSDDSNEPVQAPKPKLVYEVTVNQPGLPKGELVQIPGLGEFENGSTFDVDEDQHNAFRTYHSGQEMAQDDDGAWYVSNVKPGPTLLQAFPEGTALEVVTYASKGGSN